MTIETLGDLQDHLQTAVEVEWSTIPPYLCALYSIEDGHNLDAATTIRDVVMEEMLHLTLASNVLNALGRSPALGAAQMPSYPGPLPHSDESFEVSLLPLSPTALETFRRIELPAAVTAPHQPARYHTIAQFYEAVEDGLRVVGANPAVWTGDRAFQVGPEHYYGSGGGAMPVTDLESALAALEEVVEQGEGSQTSIYEEGDAGEIAHYYRFDELYRGRRYAHGDTPQSGPTGPPLTVDYDHVRPMAPNPKAESYAPGSDLRRMADACNATYTTLVTQLQTAFAGQPDVLTSAVHTMYELKYQAVALMNVPVGEGQTAGPPFEWAAASAAA
ncbi:MAG: hypothetical protein QOJ12_3436 [Thermoleophilales bacterium]|nr:hypothetical protein [Thermoleophilales bacterium]